MKIIGCPRDQVDEGTWLAFTMARNWRNGMGAPVAGGQLDQTPWFIAFASMILAEMDAAMPKRAGRPQPDGA